MRWLKKTYPWLKWVISFADATQCGDGTIYRASGFVLTGIKVNNQIWEAPTGEVFNDTSIHPGIGGQRQRKRAARVFSRTSLTDGRSKQQQAQAVGILHRTTTKGKHILNSGASSMRAFKEGGWKPKKGFQLRYIYFLKHEFRKNLTVPILSFSEIDKMGAGMYKGKQRIQSRAGGDTTDTPGVHPGEGGSTPTPALQFKG